MHLQLGNAQLNHSTVLGVIFDIAYIQGYIIMQENNENCNEIGAQALMSMTVPSIFTITNTCMPHTTSLSAADEFDNS